MRHFLGRLYKALFRAQVNLSWTKLFPNELKDLQLHKDFLLFANAGISLNIVAYRKPTCIYRSDASEFGLGGYSVLTGDTWRWELPIKLRMHTSINSLEFIAYVITVWVDMLAAVIQPEDCILSQTDNTSAAGWLRKSNFAEENDEYIQLVTARKLASLVMESKTCIYNQWFSGETYSIDSLSRDFHVEPTHLCNLLCENFPFQVPFGLRLSLLPNEIISWVTSLLLSHQQIEPWLKEPVRSSFARGSAFKSTCSPLESQVTPTLTASIETRNMKSCAPLASKSEKVDLVLSSI